jgi:hypothetical protein
MSKSVKEEKRGGRMQVKRDRMGHEASDNV